MSDTPQNKVTLTWQQKLDQGVRLTESDTIKMDADFNWKQQLAEQERRKAHENLKRQAREERPTEGSELKKGK